MLSRLEVRVGKANEDFAQLVLFEEIGQELHGICPDACRVLEHLLVILLPQCPNLLLDEFGDVCTDFKSCVSISYLPVA